MGWPGGAFFSRPKFKEVWRLVARCELSRAKQVGPGKGEFGSYKGPVQKPIGETGGRAVRR